MCRGRLAQTSILGGKTPSTVNSLGVCIVMKKKEGIEGRENTKQENEPDAHGKRLRVRGA